nr:Rac-like GTP-binding protein 7 [Tanacetum cinerariifolium]
PKEKGRSISDAEQMWNRLANTIKEAAKETLGLVEGTLRTCIGRKESWWISDDVQGKFKAKQTRFRELKSMLGEDKENRSAAKE